MLTAIIEHGYKATYKDIKDATGLSEGRIKDIVNGKGKDEQKRHGLRYKCPQLEIEKVDITIRTEEDADKFNHSLEKERRTRHINELTLPKDFKVINGTVSSLITLDASRRIPDATTTQDKTSINNNIDVHDAVNEDIDREENIPPSERDDIPSSFPLNTTKTCVNASRSQPIAKDRDAHDAQSNFTTQTEPTDNGASIASLSANAAAMEKDRAEHFKTPPKSKETIVCAVCGADLIVNGKIVKGHTCDNGKFCCAQPGCGYPKRGEEART